MPVQKRSSTKGSNSVTAKLINKTKANIGLHNNINNHSLNDTNGYTELNGKATQSHFQNHHFHNKSDDEVIVLTAKQKQQLQRNEYLEQLTKEQLKIEAKRRGQKTSGTKTELVFKRKTFFYIFPCFQNTSILIFISPVFVFLFPSPSPLLPKTHDRTFIFFIENCFPRHGSFEYMENYS